MKILKLISLSIIFVFKVAVSIMSIIAMSVCIIITGIYDSSRENCKWEESKKAILSLKEMLHDIWSK